MEALWNRMLPAANDVLPKLFELSRDLCFAINKTRTKSLHNLAKERQTKLRNHQFQAPVIISSVVLFCFQHCIDQMIEMFFYGKKNMDYACLIDIVHYTYHVVDFFLICDNSSISGNVGNIFVIKCMDCNAQISIHSIWFTE